MVWINILLFLITLTASYFSWVSFVPYAVYVSYTLLSRFLDLKAVDVSKEKEKAFEYKLQEFESRLGRVEMDQV